MVRCGPGVDLVKMLEHENFLHVFRNLVLNDVILVDVDMSHFQPALLSMTAFACSSLHFQHPAFTRPVQNLIEFVPAGMSLHFSMGRMAFELAGISNILPTMNPSSSLPYPLATSHYHHISPEDLAPSVTQPYKRKRTASMENKLESKKNKAASQSDITDLGSPESQHTLRETTAEVVRRSCRSISATHHTVLQHRSELDKAAREHARILNDHPPENPLLPGTNKPRFTFSTYQMKLPTELLINQIKEEPGRLEHLAQGKRFWRTVCIRNRLRRNLTPRNWEWAIYEPDRLVSNHTINETAAFVKGRKHRHKPDLEDGDTNLRYFERVEKFTYTRGEDPVFKGEKFKLGRRNSLVRLRGDFADEVDDQDFESEYSSESEESEDSEEDTCAIDDGD